MEQAPSPAARSRRSVRILLKQEQAEALERRAERHTRFPWLEAQAIVLEALVRDGDLPAEEPAQ